MASTYTSYKKVVLNGAGEAIAKCTWERDAERIAAALNAQAGVVEALRELEDAQLMPHELERASIGEEHIVRLLVASENARAALAAVKGVDRG